MLSHIISSLFVLIALIDFSFFSESNDIYTRTAPKWIALYLVAAVGVAQLLYLKHIKLKVNSNFTKLFVVYLIGLGLCILTAPLGYLERSLSEKFLFFCLALLSSHVLLEDKNFSEKLRNWIFYSSPIIYIFVLLRVTGSSLRLFENTHHFSEYLAITCIIQGYFIFLNNKLNSKLSKKRLFFERIVFALGILCIFALKSRTALLGCTLGLGTYFLLQLKGKSLKDALKFKAILLPIALLILAFGYLNLEQLKMKSLEIRFAKWSNTLEMISEHPTGVGLGNFFSAYTLYQNKIKVDEEAREGWIIENPHNFFLENAAEEGLLSALVLFVAICYFLALLFKAPNKDAFPIFKALSIFLLVDSFFNYPQDNPLTFFTSAFCLGAVLFEGTQIPLKIKNSHKSLFALLCFLLILLIPLRYYSAFFLTSSADSKKQAIACARDSQVWVACLRSASDDLNSGRFNEAATKLTNLNRRFAGHYALQKKEIEFLWRNQKKQEACSRAKDYNSLFTQKTSLSSFYKDACEPLGND